MQSPFRLAKQEILTAELLLLESQNDSQPADYLSLSKKYEKTINEVGLDHLNVILLKELSYVNAYRLHNLDRAVNILDSALQTPRIQKDLRAEMILDKADILLLQNDPWEATFLYAQVEKENKQNPIGSLAKYKKAMLAYYTGNFDWAKMQLDVLKGSTSKLIANDAFELSLSIRENQNYDDSLNNGLLSLSRADYLYFQKKTDSALQVLNSLIEDSPNPTITDDALFKQAEIFLDTNREEKAIKSLEKIYSDYLYGIWGHKASYLLGKIYEERKDFDKALNYYQQLLDKFPNSFYHIDSRNKIRESKDKAKSIDPNT